MKKQIIILLLFSIHAYSQNAKSPRIKLTSACTEEFANNYKGKWLITTDKSNYSAEVKKRFQLLQELLLETYPEPTGGDAAWNGSFMKSSFANQVTYEWNQNQMFNEEPVKINTVYSYYYNLIIYPWYCCGTNEICNIYPEISGGVGLTIYGNDVRIIQGNYLTGKGEEWTWTIDGRPVKIKSPVTEKLMNYDIITTAVGPSVLPLSTTRMIMITRNGMLPYIPVTRKQYFDKTIPFVTKFYDDNIAYTNQITDKAYDQAYKDDSKKAFAKLKNEALDRLKDELEKTTKARLLDAPAIVRYDPLLQNEGPVFTTEEEGGNMLVTENPDYFRKDLPNYVPQIFVIRWSWNDQAYGMRFKQAIEENFPIEKLKAMIDK
jgi:hypothetical protein